MLDLIVAISDKMVGPALLLGFAAIVWIAVTAKRKEPVEDFTPWEDWDWPIPDDEDDWNFPDREAA